MHSKGNNSIAEDLMEELAPALSELGTDPSVPVVILACEYGKYFTSGVRREALRRIPGAAGRNSEERSWVNGLPGGESPRGQ